MGKLRAPAVKQRPGAHEVSLEDNVMKACTGSNHGGFQIKLLNDTIRTVSAVSVTDNGQDQDKARKTVVGATIEALKAFEPKDAIEGMLAAQAVALHSASMECFRRAMLGQQPAEISSKLRKDGANLARAMTDMIEALDRKRGKGRPQVVRVERVVVHDGGQAMVGNVTTGAAVSRPLEPVVLSGLGSVPLESSAIRRREGGGDEDRDR